MSEVKFEIDQSQIKEVATGMITDLVKKGMESNLDDIKRSIDEFFKKEFLSNRKNKFDTSLDWVIEQAFRESLEKVMTELGFKEMIADKAKELLSTEKFIEDLAIAKVRSSLNLPRKDDVYEDLAKKLGLKEVGMNVWENSEGEQFVLTRLGFKRA